MINIKANLLAEPTFSSFENEGEKVEVANFVLVKKYGKGKERINYVAYGEKSDISKYFKQRDFVKLFGQVKTFIDDNFYSKLLKAKEQMRGQEEKKEASQEVER